MITWHIAPVIRSARPSDGLPDQSGAAGHEPAPATIDAEAAAIARDIVARVTATTHHMSPDEARALYDGAVSRQIAVRPHTDDEMNRLHALTGVVLQHERIYAGGLHEELSKYANDALQKATALCATFGVPMARQLIAKLLTAVLARNLTPLLDDRIGVELLGAHPVAYRWTWAVGSGLCFAGAELGRRAAQAGDVRVKNIARVIRHRVPITEASPQPTVSREVPRQDDATEGGSGNGSIASILSARRRARSGASPT